VAGHRRTNSDLPRARRRAQRPLCEAIMGWIAEGSPQCPGQPAHLRSQPSRHHVGQPRAEPVSVLRRQIHVHACHAVVVMQNAILFLLGTGIGGAAAVAVALPISIDWRIPALAVAIAGGVLWGIASGRSHSLTRNRSLGYSGKRWGSRLPVGWPWTLDVALPHSVAGELSVLKGRVASPPLSQSRSSSSGPSGSHSISNPVPRFYEVSYQ